MKVREILRKLSAKDAVFLGSVACVGYNLYCLREVVKLTIHRHTDVDQDVSNLFIKSDTSLSGQYRDFQFGFNSESR